MLSETACHWDLEHNSSEFLFFLSPAGRGKTTYDLGCQISSHNLFLVLSFVITLKTATPGFWSVKLSGLRKVGRKSQFRNLYVVSVFGRSCAGGSSSRFYKFGYGIAQISLTLFTNICYSITGSFRSVSFTTVFIYHPVVLD